MPRRGWLQLLVWLAAGAAGCSPVLDWREIRADGTPVSLLLPCRPALHARSLTLAGQQVSMHMRSCEADGAIWAVAWVDMPDPHHVGPAIRHLQKTLGDRLSAAVLAETAFQPPGATPNEHATHVLLQGRASDGRSVWSSSAVFARATTVFQVSVLASRSMTEAAGVSLESVRAAP